MGDMPHIPVLLKDVLEWMNPQKGQLYIDATLGFGGHATSILKKLGSEGFLIGIDRDKDALESAKKHLSPFEGQFELFHANYSEMDCCASQREKPFADGILLDLGVSSAQIDREERGFSFRSEAPLDMRMDREEKKSAFDLVNHAEEKELVDIFFTYGEERFSRKMARNIVKQRKDSSITTTTELAKIALSCYRRYSKIHPATRIFQALRIAVNRELFHLEAFLAKGLSFLKKGARLCIISYHSLEDRLVKKAFKDFFERGFCKKLHSKPIVPDQEEIALNRRARSAKMRICEKIQEG